MRIRSLFVVATLCFIMFSCQKERSLEDGTIPGATLAKIVIKLGNTDSTVTTYGYDNKRFNSQTVDGDDYLINGDDVKLTRNSDGIIQKIEITDPSSTNMTFTVNYDNASKKYINKMISYTNQGGASVTDSIAYKYNASGKISEEVSYTKTGGSGGYAETGKFEYSYDGNGSVVSMKDYYYDESTGEFVGISEVSLAYDNKTNPLNLGIEAILLDDVIFNSAFNVTKFSINNFLDPTYNETINFEYTYDATNKPLTANITFESIGFPIPAYYVYK